MGSGRGYVGGGGSFKRRWKEEGRLLEVMAGIRFIVVLGFFWRLINEWKKGTKVFFYS